MPEFCATCLRRRGADGCSCTTVGASQNFQNPMTSVGTQRFPASVPPRRSMMRALTLTAVVFVVIATAVTTGVFLAVNRFSQQGNPVAASGVTTVPAAAAVPPLASGPATITGASASCTSGPGVDSAGNPFTYNAPNAVDARPETAWRCDHDGAGARLVITFDRPAVISWIGVVPGFAKTDPYDGTDRYVQGRKISAARFVFDDGTYVEHSFDTWSASRAMQVFRFAPTTTARVEMVVLASVPGSPVNGFGPTDKIAVSELAVG